MEFVKVSGKDSFKPFYNVCSTIYSGNTCYRRTEYDIVKMLCQGPCSFHEHADIHPYLIVRGSRVTGRFALICDHKLPEYVQLAFFEALPDQPGLIDKICQLARESFPHKKKLVAGINGHINYSAGFLASHFDQPPLLGLPYTQPYYIDYFHRFSPYVMWSFRFPTEPFFLFKNRFEPDSPLDGITVRCMRKRRFRQETALYTELNNRSFQNHPFWADRSVDEDFELFYPFRFFINPENLLFAEQDGRTIGFLLWYPDFNSLAASHEHLGLKHVLRYRFQKKINLFRFTQIAVLPEKRVSKTVLALILALTPYIEKLGYEYGEGGFIFAENVNSMNMARRYLLRATGVSFEPHRKYMVFESRL